MVAIQVDLDTDGFSYFKWGAQQRCKPGDWLVDNGGDVYSVDQAVFAETYRKVATGHYIKVTPIWAEQATEDGSVVTKEGKSYYKAGDYLVTNSPEDGDEYCMSKRKFEEMYEPD